MEQIQGENVTGVELNDILHKVEDELAGARIDQLSLNLNNEIRNRQNNDALLQSNIQAETTARSSADSTLQSNIEAETTARTTSVQSLQEELSQLNTLLSTIQSRVNEINALIPTQASEDNQLADKDFVNSSVSTNTAYFVGTFNSVEELPTEGITNNDYAFVKTTDTVGNTVYKRYKYNSEESEWIFEYDLNNSSFTAEQWATINSGLTQSKIEQEFVQKSTVNQQTIESTNVTSDTPINFKANATNGACYVRFINGDTALGYFGIGADKKPYFYDTSGHRLALLEEVLPLSGGTMTGKIKMPLNMYASAGGALNMNNSDIVGANAIMFGDHSEFGEGLGFPRTNETTIDMLRVHDGNLYLGTSASDEKKFDSLYYEDIQLNVSSWSACGNVFYAGSLKTWDSSMRDKIITASVIHWSGIRPWISFDHYDSGGSYMTLNLYSAVNVSGVARIRIWYIK